MVKKIVEYIKGWLYICVTGANLERFLNICNHTEIEMRDISFTTNNLKLRISIGDFKKLKDIARKTKVHIKIEERYGLPFFLFKNRKRKMFLAGVISAMIMVHLLSQYVWQISFEGNYSYTEYELIDFLYENGVDCGIKKKNCNPEEIEKALRNKFNDIKWASVEIVGTRMIVHIKENFNEINEAVETGNYNIIAEKDGQIISIITGKGTPLVKAGDTVTKGQILIGGYYEIMSDFGELMETRHVQADGTIIAKTIYSLNENISRYYEKKVYTGKKSKKYQIRVFDKKLDIDWFYDKYKVCDEINKTKQLVIGKNFYLPMYYGKYISREYKLEEVYLSSEEAYEQGQKYIDDFLQKLIEKGIQITQNNVTIEVNEKNITVSGDIECYEYIGEKRIEQYE